MMDENTIQLFGSKKTDHWQTPDLIFELLYKKYEIKKHQWFDPCPRHPTHDGLKIDWDKKCFVNPPYSRVMMFLIKATNEIHKGNTELAVFLTFANTDTRFFHEYVLNNPVCDCTITFLRGRLKFISDDGVKNSAMRPSILIEMRKKCDKR